jgi:hypothetical protein
VLFDSANCPLLNYSKENLGFDLLALKQNIQSFVVQEWPFGCGFKNMAWVAKSC